MLDESFGKLREALRPIMRKIVEEEMAGNNPDPVVHSNEYEGKPKFKKPVVLECMGTYERIGANIGCLVDAKNVAYGDSFKATPKMLEILYPDGIPVEQYRNALAIVRVLDKMKRIATANDSMGESPWDDITGYGVLMVEANAE